MCTHRQLPTLSADHHPAGRTPVNPPSDVDARCTRTIVGGRRAVGLASADVGPVGYAGWAAQVTPPSGDVVGHRMTLLVSGP
jgi:hypothetical protein